VYAVAFADGVRADWRRVRCTCRCWPPLSAFRRGPRCTLLGDRNPSPRSVTGTLRKLPTRRETLQMGYYIDKASGTFAPACVDTGGKKVGDRRVPTPRAAVRTKHSEYQMHLSRKYLNHQPQLSKWAVFDPPEYISSLSLNLRN